MLANDLGYEPADVIGQPAFGFSHRADIAEQGKMARQALAESGLVNALPRAHPASHWIVDNMRGDVACHLRS